MPESMAQKQYNEARDKAAGSSPNKVQRLEYRRSSARESYYHRGRRDYSGHSWSRGGFCRFSTQSPCFQSDRIIYPYSLSCLEGGFSEVARNLCT
jgi:hypothetical protein